MLWCIDNLFSNKRYIVATVSQIKWVLNIIYRLKKRLKYVLSRGYKDYNNFIEYGYKEKKGAIHKIAILGG